MVIDAFSCCNLLYFINKKNTEMSFTILSLMKFHQKLAQKQSLWQLQHGYNERVFSRKLWGLVLQKFIFVNEIKERVCELNLSLSRAIIQIYGNIEEIKRTTK